MSAAERKWFKSLTGNTAGDYTLESFIGHGRIGYVYRACARHVTDWEVALKITPSSRMNDQWQNEIKKVSRLSTIRGVVHFHGLGTCPITHEGHTEVCLFTVWDYIPPGRNLKEFLQISGKRIHASFLIAVVEQVLRTLHACQAKGIPRHGDLHAGNILIGDPDAGDIDSSLRQREQVYVSDFGYGATGGKKPLKDDYAGLAEIANAIIPCIDWAKATPSDRHLIVGLRKLLAKVLGERSESERSSPIEILTVLQQLKASITPVGVHLLQAPERQDGALPESKLLNAGQFQISEMLGDRWEWWKKLFVATVPARSRILVPDISTVVTGPRGCGKTMLFRRLSERLIVECGPVSAELHSDAVGFYVNANDIADAFPDFGRNTSTDSRNALVAYANLCVLADILAVLAARKAKQGQDPPDPFIDRVKSWLIDSTAENTLITGESLLENLRSHLETIKWSFSGSSPAIAFPALPEFSRTGWLPRVFSSLRSETDWIGLKPIFLFIDDYSTPRVSLSLQRVLNRLLFQRSSEFVTKVATESATTFVPEDSSGKMLQDGDDYQLVDMGEESLFMTDEERTAFLDEVLTRRLALDPRVPVNGRSLRGLLGELGMSKTEFARRLRLKRSEIDAQDAPPPSGSQRRGASKGTVTYHGADVFCALWSGDTRIMIQLIQELLGEANETTTELTVPVPPDKQDRIFRDRGSTWLEAQTRNHPTRPEVVSSELASLQEKNASYELTGKNYGTHLKAIVEAFVAAARRLLLGTTYKIGEREVPRMAFRIEVIDDFRVEGLAAELYRDLIRYGLFMRDARGKSVRGAMVPRLYIRRLLLPYCTLALSKRDSVPMTCEWFRVLLLTPDTFKREFLQHLGGGEDSDSTDQMVMGFAAGTAEQDPMYDDLPATDS